MKFLLKYPVKLVIWNSPVAVLKLYVEVVEDIIRSFESKSVNDCLEQKLYVSELDAVNTENGAIAVVIVWVYDVLTVIEGMHLITWMLKTFENVLPFENVQNI